jgi:hypothetical protein
MKVLDSLFEGGIRFPLSSSYLVKHSYISSQLGLNGVMVEVDVACLIGGRSS